MKTFIITIFCTITVLNSVVIAQAQEGPGPEQSRRAGMAREGAGSMREGNEAFSGMLLNKVLENEKISAELGLSAEQRTVLKEGLYKFQLRQIELNAEMQKSALEQAKVMVADKVDEQALMAAIEKSGAIHTEMAKLRMQPLLLIKRNLSAEQIEKAKDIFREQARKRMMEGRGDKLREQGKKGHEYGEKMREAGQKGHESQERDERRKEEKASWRERAKDRMSNAQRDERDQPHPQDREEQE